MDPADHHDACGRLDDPDIADTPLWLSHHWPEEYDRCAVVRGRHVCRRCLVLYPGALATAVVLGVAGSWPERLDPWLLWLLPLPASVEFVAEQLGLARHSPRRQVALTALLAVGAGRLYVRYLDDHADALVWSVVATYLLACLAAFAVRIRRR